MTREGHGRTAEVEVPAPAADVVESLATAIVDTGRSYLALADLLAVWSTVDPGWAGRTGGRLRLADALERLHVAGALELPSKRGTRWDPVLPRLPTQVAVPANRRAPTRALDPATEPWVPALAWAPGWIRAARPPQRMRLALVTVNRWLASIMGRAPDVVCREERSLEIFGDEKTLGKIAASVLFEPGRLTLELLHCEPPVGGVRIARLREAGLVLVMENKATFDSAWRALRGDLARGRHVRYAALVFGGGDQAAALVPDLTVLHELVGVKPSGLEYAGDVDVAGVSAAAAFIDAAVAAGLSAVPALPLWVALGNSAVVGPDETGHERERAAALAAVERLGLPDAVAARLREGTRIPQERLDRTRLADTSWWAAPSDQD